MAAMPEQAAETRDTMNVQTITHQLANGKAKTIAELPLGGTANRTTPLCQIIKHGDMKLSPTLAKRVLADCHFDAQDARTKHMEYNVSLYAEAMRRGFWNDYS